MSAFNYSKQATLCFSLGDGWYLRKIRSFPRGCSFECQLLVSRNTTDISVLMADTNEKVVESLLPSATQKAVLVLGELNSQTSVMLRAIH